MIEVLAQLRVLQIQSGKSYETIAANTGHSKATVNDIMTGKREDFRLQTILDVAAELGADIALVTEQSRKAIAEQDISFYRNEIAARESDLDSLRSEIAWLRSERVEEIKFYRDQIALLRDQINRKDAYIDLVVEVARKGGDLKSVQFKGSEHE